MSEYKSIKGKTVQFLGTDPSETSTEGQVWYNSTAGAFKSLLALEAWSSGAPLLNARRGGASGGTQTAGLAFGGRTPPGTDVADTEEYNGSGWTTGGNLGTARYNLASATNAPQTAGLAFGSATSPDTTTEEYNGSSWTAGPALNTGRGFLGGAGTQTAGLGFGGYAGGDVNNVEEYNGTAWTAVTAMPSARRQMGGVGLQTAALSIGAYGSPSNLNVTEEYDGTNWTSGGTYPQVIMDVRAAGIQTDTLAFGGSPPPSKTTLTTNYDGTSWTTKPSMATPRTAHFGAGTSSAAFAAGGLTGAPPGPSSTAFTEEYNKSTTVFTPAAWSSGGNLNTARRTLGSAGAGTQTATLAFGGFSPSGFLNSSESYNGSSWTATPNLNTSRGELGGAGTQTAGLAFGGTIPGATTATESWNGTSWTTVNSLNTGRFAAGFCGTQTAALYAGGNTTSNVAEEYDGTNWTTVNTMNVSRRQGAGVGLQTAAVMIGSDSPSPNEKTTSFYDGTDWTAGPLTNISHTSGGTAFGIQSSHIVVGGTNNLTTAEQYDGSSYATTASLGTGRFSAGRSGNTTNGVVFGGGSGGSYLTATEEFTGETSAINIKTLTTG